MRQEKTPGLIIAIWSLVLEPYMDRILLTQRDTGQERLQVFSALENISGMNEFFLQVAVLVTWR
jgi:hypothetical protein